MNKLNIIFFTLFFPCVIFSSNIDPVVFLENILIEIKPSLLHKDDFFLEKTIRKYVDFNEVAICVSGKQLWSLANEDDRLNFIDALATLMVSTYRKTVYYYIDSDIDFLRPKSKNFLDAKRKIQISSFMKKDNKSVNISYRLVKHGDSWLVFDILIEGISILKSLQTQYTALIKQYGIVYVTKKIHNSNSEK
ncbi:MAG: ABC transporter substrate-binding protein [Candidatus Riesia sp.]|nr:ABC transporter substrate-binding protein [Candidatus Riesia sp.]